MSKNIDYDVSLESPAGGESTYNVILRYRDRIVSVGRFDDRLPAEREYEQLVARYGNAYHADEKLPQHNEVRAS
jgi:hypothetical protein